MQYREQQVLHEAGIGAKIDGLNTKMDSVLLQLEKLDQIDARLVKLEGTMILVNEDIKAVKQQVNEMDAGLTNLNTECEENRVKLRDVNKEVKSLSQKAQSARQNEEKTRADLVKIEENLSELTEKHIEQQWRSMRDNLIFSGIEEKDEEDTETELKNFLLTEMHMTNIDFHRVHRMGRRETGKTRPIVAKFVLCKVREDVRKRVPTALKGKAYGINEQFPKEINEKRKTLYPHLKAAKNQGKKAVLIRDKLYIEGTLFTPDTVAVGGTRNQQGREQQRPRGQQAPQQTTGRDK
jgi:chromosome segregation ATPase